jgi:hypothetical protein
MVIFPGRIKRETPSGGGVYGGGGDGINAKLQSDDGSGIAQDCQSRPSHLDLEIV